jgi:hypothetical protein
VFLSTCLSRGTYTVFPRTGQPVPLMPRAAPRRCDNTSVFRGRPAHWHPRQSGNGLVLSRNKWHPARFRVPCGGPI